MTTRKTSSNVPARSPAKAPKAIVPKSAKKTAAAKPAATKAKSAPAAAKPAKPVTKKAADETVKQKKTAAAGKARTAVKSPARAIPKPRAKSAGKPTGKSAGGKLGNKDVGQIGQAVSQLHHLLKELGHIKGLERTASTMPDARERLNFIDQTMHEASEKTISAVENSLPRSKASLKACTRISKKLAAAEDLAHHALVQEAISVLGEIASAEEAVHHDLMQIMEAQEFRDVAGQMVNKIVGAAVEIETILLDILREYAPHHGDSLISREGLTAGPALDDKAGNVQGQDDVDDLLASMGF